ncbi:hypothetical protein BS47DRAFT_488477 [Hydnum rufescens UP504]|uniref:Protein PNS1 n=1 Tax=Hydnum rufescens UP504 TaxID=1448309 RepID=A0A9P6AJ67_9AGAM|nr:hypothetical protein BS47DRAFT_488477 [Hydnum rufescens UP504]
MQTPFSIYASAFLNRTVNPASSTSSQPLFYSATGGSEDDDDGPFRRVDDTPGNRSLIDEDDGVPRLAGDDGGPRVPGKSRVLFDSHQETPYLDETELEAESRGHHDYVPSERPEDDDSDDPYLAGFPQDMDSLPMMDSGMVDSSRSVQPSPPKKRRQSQGWLTHVSVSQPPISRPHSEVSSRSPSPSNSSSSVPPSYLTTPLPPPPVTQTRTTTSVQLTESLLPRDGISRSLFYLPDPDRPVGRSKYNDSPWMTAWLTAVSFCAVGSLLILFVTNSSPKPTTGIPMTPIPYSTLTHTIPLLTTLTLTSAGLSYGYLILFRFAVRPMLVLTALSTPLFLFLSSAYAFSGSFFSAEPGVPNTWGETIGLRLFSVIPLGLAYVSAKSFYARYESLLQTASVVELSTSLLISHPSVLILSLGILFISFIASLPFLSLALRLLLVGYFSHPSSSQSQWVWHVQNYAGTLATVVLLIWLWSWAISRGVMRVVVGGVVGHWYFTAHDPAYTLLSQQQATRAALARATGPSLGSICAGSLILGSVQGMMVILQWLRKLTTPPALQFIAPLHPLSFLTGVISILDSLSTYALVYIGITGEGFWPSARVARSFMTSVAASDREGEVSGRRRRRVRGRRISDYTLVSNLLTMSALSLAVLSAIGGFLFAAHSLAAPTNAPLSAFTCGIVTFLTVRFGLGLGEDAADAMFVCYNIDVQAGTKHRSEVFEAFDGHPPQGPLAV